MPLSPRGEEIQRAFGKAFRQCAEALERANTDDALREVIEYLLNDITRTLRDDLRVASGRFTPLDGVEDRMEMALERLRRISKK